jgi:hypothetical protein
MLEPGTKHFLQQTCFLEHYMLNIIAFREIFELYSNGKAQLVRNIGTFQAITSRHHTH